MFKEKGAKNAFTYLTFVDDITTGAATLLRGLSPSHGSLITFLWTQLNRMSSF